MGRVFEALCVVDDDLRLAIAGLMMDRIIGSRTLRIDHLEQLHCMWCCGILASTNESDGNALFSAGLLTYLAKVNNEGNMCGEFKCPDYDRGLESSGIASLFEEYCLLLTNFAKGLGDKVDFLNIAAPVWTKVLSEPRVASARALMCCLQGVSECKALAFDNLLKDNLLLSLQEILKSTEQYPQNPGLQDLLLMHTLNAISVFADELTLMEEMKVLIPKLCIRVLTSEATLKSSLRFLDLFKENSLSFSLEKLQFEYHKLARSSDLQSRFKAERFAEAAAERKLDYFGLKKGYLQPSLDFHETFRYYMTQITGSVQCYVEDEVIQLICSFAVETYRLHQLVDAQDCDHWWCSAEIVDVELTSKPLVKVHFTGFDDEYDEWMEVPSQTLAPAFTFTKIELPVANVVSTTEFMDPRRMKWFVSSDVLGLTMEKAQKICSGLAGNVDPWTLNQCFINCARWMNRHNLTKLL
eukprot:TRINITY_DN10243_c0_g1_i1.p2 TRINITY_DN10243_c0_g1~~TRINITY_DN10243_c0_g1_i1.p2  ORF type:complete len:537 (-),score=112.48 TRINITY_DN10243_c0_g1_i1:1951-3354(-)